jgi:hypothetical protein
VRGRLLPSGPTQVRLIGQFKEGKKAGKEDRTKIGEKENVWSYKGRKKQEVLGTTNRLFSFYYNLLI